MKTQNRFRHLAVGVSVIFALILTANNTTVKAAPGCNDETIAGNYGFALSGLVSASFKGQPQQDWRVHPTCSGRNFLV